MRPVRWLCSQSTAPQAPVSTMQLSTQDCHNRDILPAFQSTVFVLGYRLLSQKQLMLTHRRIIFSISDVRAQVRKNPRYATCNTCLTAVRAEHSQYSNKREAPAAQNSYGSAFFEE